MRKSVLTDFNELTKIMKIKRLIPILALPFFINSCEEKAKKADEKIDEVKEHVGEKMDAAGDKIAEGVDKIKSHTDAKVDDAKKHTKEVVDHVTEKTESTGEAIKQKVDDAAQQLLNLHSTRRISSREEIRFFVGKTAIRASQIWQIINI